jgi:hypothetical protein
LSMTHDVDWIFCSHLISMKIYKTSSKRPRNPSFRVHPRNTGWGWGKITLGKQPCFSFSQSIEFYRFNNLEGKAPPLTYLKSYNMGFRTSWVLWSRKESSRVVIGQYTLPKNGDKFHFSILIWEIPEGGIVSLSTSHEQHTLTGILPIVIFQNFLLTCNLRVLFIWLSSEFFIETFGNVSSSHSLNGIYPFTFCLR